MRNHLLFLVAIGLCLGLPSVARASAPSHGWSQLFGNAADQYGEAIAIDIGGNVLVTGTFWGALNLGGSNLTSAGSTDIFLAKFDAAGAHQWSVRFGDASTQNSVAIATGPAGEVAIAGYFRGTVDFGDGSLTSAGANDIFVACFDANGVHRWSRRFGASSSDYAFGVALDPNGNVVLAGSFVGAVNFGGASLVSQGEDIFVASYTSSGVHRWSARYGDHDAQAAYAVAIGPSGGPVIAGGFGGTVDFGGGNLVSAGMGDAFVASLNSLGGHVWSGRYGDAGDQSCLGVDVDGEGNVWATGVLAGTADFGGGALTSAGDYDVFVAGWTSAGAHRWSGRFGDAAEQTAFGIAADAGGGVCVTGRLAGTIDFGGGPLTSAGGYDAFVALLGATGAHEWSARFGDSAGDVGLGVAAHASGAFAITGFARGTVDFGGGGLVAAGADAFAAVFARTPSGVRGPGSSSPLAVTVHPNPFNPATTVRFTTRHAGPVSVVVYSAHGARVASLLDGVETPAGEHALAWNGNDDAGRFASSGVYFVRVSAAGETATQKMVLLK